jgi:hypothetical protein
LQGLAKGWPGSSVVAVHHDRKAKSDDFLDSASGTKGLTGSADSVLMLTRPRNEAVGKLQLTSRDAPEGEYALRFVSGHWLLSGGSLDAAASDAQNLGLVDGVGDFMTELISEINRHPEGIRPKALADALHVPDLKKVCLYLKRACEANRVRKGGRGLYTPVISVRSVRLPSSPEPSSNPPLITHITDITGGIKGSCRVCDRPLAVNDDGSGCHPTCYFEGSIQ